MASLPHVKNRRHQSISRRGPYFPTQQYRVTWSASHLSHLYVPSTTRNQVPVSTADWLRAPLSGLEPLTLTWKTNTLITALPQAHYILPNIILSMKIWFNKKKKKKEGFCLLLSYDAVCDISSLYFYQLSWACTRCHCENVTFSFFFGFNFWKLPPRS